MKVFLLIVSIVAVLFGDCHDFTEELASSDNIIIPVKPVNQDDTAAEHPLTERSPLNTDNTGDLESADDDQLLMNGITHIESQLRRSKCKARNACVVMGGFCVTNATLCSGRLVPEGCKGVNCQCCVPGLLEQEITTLGLELDSIHDNLGNFSLQQTMEFELMKDELTKETMELKYLLANISDNNARLEEQIRSFEDSTINASSNFERQLNNLTAGNLELNSKLDSMEDYASNHGCLKESWWFPQSDQCFKYIPSKANWATADSTCRAQGLELAKPLDPVALRAYIVNRYTYTNWMWLGAKGTGSKARWTRDGQTLLSNNYLWYSSGNTMSTSNCLSMMTNGHYLKASYNAPYYMVGCTATYTFLCEYVRK